MDKMRKYLCAEPGRKHEQLAKPVSPSLLRETTKLRLIVLPTVQESSQHHPSAEGVQLIVAAQNCSPLTEPFQCPTIHCQGYQYQLCWTNRYLLANDLWLHVNVSLKHKRLLSGTAQSRGIPRSGVKSLKGDNLHTLPLPIPSWH